MAVAEANWGFVWIVIYSDTRGNLDTLENQECKVVISAQGFVLRDRNILIKVFLRCLVGREKA